MRRLLLALVGTASVIGCARPRPVASISLTGTAGKCGDDAAPYASAILWKHIDAKEWDRVSMAPGVARLESAGVTYAAEVTIRCTSRNTGPEGLSFTRICYANQRVLRAEDGAVVSDDRAAKAKAIAEAAATEICSVNGEIT